MVTPARETWHCFGCGRGGDIFNFVMERDGDRLPDGAAAARRPRRRRARRRTSREDAQRKRLREALEAAIAFYHQVLTAHPHGQPALDYLRGRGFTDSTIETFQLGYAPDSWDALTRALIGQARLPRGRARGGRPRLASAGRRRQRRARRLRPLPRPDHLPHPRRERRRERPRRPGRSAAQADTGQVHQHAGDAAVRQEPHALPDRPRQVRDPQAGARGPGRGQHGRADGPPGGLRERRRRRLARR